MADIVAVVLNRGGYFSVVTAPKSYYLRSDSVEDAESWVASLNESIGKGPSETPKPSADATENRRSTESQPLQEKNSLTLPQPSAKNLSTDLPVSIKLQGGTQQPRSSSENEDYSNVSSPSKLAVIDVSTSVPKSLVSGSHMSCYPYSGTEDLGQSSCPSNHSLQLESANLDDDDDLDDNTIKARVPMNETLIPSAAQQLQQGNTETVGETEQALEPLQSEEKVLEAGYLLRLKKRYRHWRKQYVVLTNERMIFYKHEKSKTPLKVIKMSKLIDVVEQDAMSKTKQYCMLVITPEKRMRFCAQSEEELVRWLSVIRALIDVSMSARSVEA